MADELLLSSGRDSKVIQARLRELGAGLTFSLVAGQQLRTAVRLPSDLKAAAECRRLIAEWNRGP